MTRRASTLAVAAFFLAAACGTGPRSAPPAPDFEARTLDGKPFKLSALKGKVVLLDFWATWCGPCEETIPRLIALDQKYRSKGLEIVGVSLDDEEGNVPPFVKAHKMQYAVVVDAEKRVGDLYDVHGIPMTVLVGRDGKGRGRWMGAGDDVADEIEKEIRAAL